MTVGTTFGSICSKETEPDLSALLIATIKLVEEHSASLSVESIVGVAVTTDVRLKTKLGDCHFHIANSFTNMH